MRKASFCLLGILLAGPAQANETGVQEIRLTKKEIAISGEVLFETGSAKLSPKSYDLLDQIAKLVKNNPKLPRIQITGHTDDVGDADRNLKLSADRAESVRQYLIAAGVKSNRLVAMGYGESQPLEQGTTPADRAKNRRVDFIIMRPFSISANIGLAQSIPSGVDDASGGMGLLIGGLVHYGVSDQLELQGGLNYINRNVTVDDRKEFGIGYIEVPISAHYLLPTMAGAIHPFAGGGFSFGLAAGAHRDGSSIEATGLLPSFVIESGATYEAPFGLMRAQLRYSQALGSALADDDDLKISALDLQVGYVF